MKTKLYLKTKSQKNQDQKKMPDFNNLGHHYHVSVLALLSLQKMWLQLNLTVQHE